MNQFFIKNKKYFCLALLFAVVFNFVFLPPLTVWADDSSKAASGNSTVSWFEGKALLFISSTVSAIFGYLFGFILFIEAQLIDYILSPTNFSFTSSPIVTLGWGITRDLANMFFILILLVIAFATVLRIDSYAIKQLWFKVLVAALLINFSLVIAGVVIDFTQVLTTFFLKQATGGGTLGTITTRLASSMQILNFYNPASANETIKGVAQFAGSAPIALIGIVLTLIGLVVTVFVFGAAVIFLVVRILYIWFLLIVAPFAWMLWILPATSGYFKQWWDKFISWTFFAPAYVFMIYLSLSIFSANGALKTGVFPANSNAAWGKAAPGLTTVGMPSAIFQWILVIAMMYGSLIIAKQFGVEGAAGAQKILTGWGTGAKNWAGRQLRRQALGWGAKPAAEGKEAKAGWLVRGAQALAGTAIPGRRLIAQQAFNMAAGEAKTVEEAQKQFASWTPDAKQQYLESLSGRISKGMFRNQYMAAALSLKQDGKLDKLDESKIKELAILASRQYPKQLDEILKVAPHLATNFNKKIKEIVQKIDKANEISLESLSSSEVVINLNPNQLKDIVQKADDKKVQRTKSVVEAEFSHLPGTLPTDLDAILNIPNKEKRNRDLNAFMNAKLATGASRDEVQRYEKIARAKATTNSPAWAI